jgi:hypothetical protein
LAVRKGRDYYIRIDRLAVKPGMNIISALTLENRSWIKAVALAAAAGTPRRSVAHWCRTRPHLAKRIGRIWYVDLEELGATDDEIDALKRWAPEKKSTIDFLTAANLLHQIEA